MSVITDPDNNKENEQMVPASKIRIKLTAFDHRVLMESVEEIVKTAKRTGADVVGPVRLPTMIKKFTVNRSPHVDKKSREQFEIRNHKAVVDIVNPKGSTYSGPCFGDVTRVTRLESSSNAGIEVVADKDTSATSNIGRVIHTVNMLDYIIAGDNISITETGTGRDRQMIISSTGGSTPTNIVTTSDSTPLVIWKGTQSAYDGITTKDENTLYIITGA